jgi:hypothetical protein
VCVTVALTPFSVPVTVMDLVPTEAVSSALPFATVPVHSSTCWVPAAFQQA